jgi:hypothetical protein
VTALKGLFGKPRKAVSISDMSAAIAHRGSSANPALAKRASK